MQGLAELDGGAVNTFEHIAPDGGLWLITYHGYGDWLAHHEDFDGGPWEAGGPPLDWRHTARHFGPKVSRERALAAMRATINREVREHEEEAL